MKRATLKSPVRENCTPGSVRGRPGNGPSYRNKGVGRRVLHLRHGMRVHDDLPEGKDRAQEL